jgi:hypothetical protein
VTVFTVLLVDYTVTGLLVTLRVAGTQRNKWHLFVLLAAGQCRRPL